MAVIDSGPRGARREQVPRHPRDRRAGGVPTDVLADRYRATLLGLAIGDALGTTLEFRPPGTFMPLTDLVGGGPFDLPVGAWTDDTSMALCLGESLIECGGFDPADQLERYVRWWHEGHLSSTGRCFDIGGTVRNALLRFERTRDPESGSTDPSTTGNGSLMRSSFLTARRYASSSSIGSFAAERASALRRLFISGPTLTTRRGEKRAARGVLLDGTPSARTP